MCEIIEIIGTAGFDEAGPRPHDTEAGETFIVGVVDHPSLRLTIPAPGNGLLHIHKLWWSWSLPISLTISDSLSLRIAVIKIISQLFGFMYYGKKYMLLDIYCADLADNLAIFFISFRAISKIYAKFLTIFLDITIFYTYYMKMQVTDYFIYINSHDLGLSRYLLLSLTLFPSISLYERLYHKKRKEKRRVITLKKGKSLKMHLFGL